MSSTGVLAELGTAAQLTEATRRMKRLGYRRLDAFAPYPVDAVEEALQVRRSPLGLYMLAGGITGLVVGYGIQWWTNGVDYPLNVGGFPPHSPPAFIPPTFETVVLFAALAGFFGLFALIGLPRLWHPLFEVEGFERATVDRFFLWVDASDARYDEARVLAELSEVAPIRVERVGGVTTSGALHGLVVVPALVLAASLLGGCDTRGVVATPELSLERMLRQNKYEAFDENPFFVDQRAMRPPPKGTVPRDAIVGRLDLTHGISGSSYVARVPMPVTRELMRKGRRRFEVMCAPCHGHLGDGDSVVARQMMLVLPPDLTSDRIRAYPPGRIYRVIREGFGVMPGYEAELSVEDRWAVVAYLGALQLSQRARLDELPPALAEEAKKVLQ
ncbi:DUF3341 domain-containing protein [Myxococcota bacterium]|nr:DUF3341 domain-containing protein [Myxococcota bacterium]